MEEKKTTISVRNNKKGFGIISTILLVLLIVCAGTLVYVFFIDEDEAPINEERELEAYIAGAKYGVDFLTLEIFNKAITCTVIPINNGSLEINLIAAECIADYTQQI